MNKLKYEHGPRCHQFSCFLNIESICGKPLIIDDDIVCVEGKINEKDYFFPEASIDVYSVGFNVIGTSSTLNNGIGSRVNNMLSETRYIRDCNGQR